MNMRDDYFNAYMITYYHEIHLNEIVNKLKLRELINLKRFIYLNSYTINCNHQIIQKVMLHQHLQEKSLLLNKSLEGIRHNSKISLFMLQVLTERIHSI